MIYLFENPNNNTSIVFAEETLTGVEKAKGIAIEELPIADEIEGKTPVLKCKKSTGEVWWEYVENSVDEIAMLKQQINDLNIALANMMGV